MKEKNGYLIGPGLAGAIKTLIESHDNSVHKSPVTRLETRFESSPAVPQQKVFRICTFTGAWSIGSAKEVTFRGVTTTPNTVSVTNLVCGLNPGTVTCDVSVAKDGTAWYLVQPNLTQLPGYSATGTQVLTITNGSLRWIGTTACT